MSKLPSKQSTQHSQCTFLLNIFQLHDIFFALADVAISQEFATVLWVLWPFSWKSLSSWVILRIEITPQSSQSSHRGALKNKCSLAALKWIIMSICHADSLHNVCVFLFLWQKIDSFTRTDQCVCHTHTTNWDPDCYDLYSEKLFWALPCITLWWWYWRVHTV